MRRHLRWAFACPAGVLFLVMLSGLGVASLVGAVA